MTPTTSGGYAQMVTSVQGANAPARAAAEWLQAILKEDWPAIVGLIFSESLFLCPLLLLAFALLLRTTGFHLKLSAGMRNSLEDLKKSGDLRSAFPSESQQRRLQQLLDSGNTSRTKAAMRRAEEALAHWFGSAKWSVAAFDKVLTISMIYPFILLLVAWMLTGQGKIGTATILNNNIPTWKRAALAFSFLFTLWLNRKIIHKKWYAIVFDNKTISLAITITIATASAFSLSVAFAGSSASSFIFTLTFAVCFIFINIINSITINLKNNSQKTSKMFTSIFSISSLMICIGWAFSPSKISKNFTQFDPNSFIFILFIGLLPIWNACLDLISIGVTRHFLQRYLAVGKGWWWMVVFDILLAVLLTVVLFDGVLGLLMLLQYWGWGIDAAATVRLMRNDPTDPQVQWILWMALTNVLPTVLHLGLACAGLWSGWLLRDAALVQALNEVRLPAPAPEPALIIGISGPRPAYVPAARPAPLQLSRPLSSSEAAKLVNWVWFDSRVAALVPLALVLACWPLWLMLMHSTLQWLASWV